MNRTNPPHKNLLPSILLIILAILLTAGCSGEGSSGDASFEMASMEQMPPDVQTAPVSVQQAYQFAFANPDVLQELPCYCGCGSMGHTSNYDCYVAREDVEGLITYDSHALGCSICVDITQDAMRMLDQGKDLKEIRTYVDDTYAQYGSSNMP